MEELLKLQSALESVKDTDNVPLELLDEINEVLQYALGWCHGWLANKACSGFAAGRAKNKGSAKENYEVHSFSFGIVYL